MQGVLKMSRVGKTPITVPNDVKVEFKNNIFTVSGPKGNLSGNMPAGITAKQDGQTLTFERKSDEPALRAAHGLARALINNMVTGVHEGFSKKLEVNGVGFRVALAGSSLRFNLGYSHDVTYDLPEGVTAAVEQNIITISGADKQQVGQVAAEIRALRKPEPYKGKGIKYVDERILRKSGKSGKESKE